jgi:hypothetical protein
MAAKVQFGRKIRNLVAAFRGLPPETSTAFSKKALTFDEVASFALKKYKFLQTSAERAIQENWISIVGERFAARCSPEKILKSDVLLIRSTSSVIRSELQLQKKKILENLHKLPRCARISDICFKF